MCRKRQADLTKLRGTFVCNHGESVVLKTLASGVRFTDEGCEEAPAGIAKLHDSRLTGAVDEVIVSETRRA
jgi:hypothetical protein